MRSQQEQLGFREHVSDGAGGDVDQGGHVFDVDLVAGWLLRVFDQLTFLAGLEFVGLNRDVLLAERLGRVPRAVRAEEVEP